MCRKPRASRASIATTSTALLEAVDGGGARILEGHAQQGVVALVAVALRGSARVISSRGSESGRCELGSIRPFSAKKVTHGMIKKHGIARKE